LEHSAIQCFPASVLRTKSTAISLLWLLFPADMFVVVHVAAAYQVYINPVFTMAEASLSKRTSSGTVNPIVQTLLRMSLVVGVTVVGLLIPFFGSLMVSVLCNCFIWLAAPICFNFVWLQTVVQVLSKLRGGQLIAQKCNGMLTHILCHLVCCLQGLFGAIAITPTTFLLPPLLWLLYKQPRKWGKEWAVNWFLVIITGIMGILGTVGAIYGIAKASSTYRVFAA
jgi:hypothetical protein